MSERTWLVIAYYGCFEGAKLSEGTRVFHDEGTAYKYAYEMNSALASFSYYVIPFTEAGVPVQEALPDG